MIKQAPKTVFATIPEPTLDLAGLHRTAMALKQAVDKMMGTPSNAEGPTGPEKKASMFVIETPPTSAEEGDFWLCKGGEMTTLSLLVAGQWKVIWQ